MRGEGVAQVWMRSMDRTVSAARRNGNEIEWESRSEDNSSVVVWGEGCRGLTKGNWKLGLYPQTDTPTLFRILIAIQRIHTTPHPHLATTDPIYV